jgi:GTP-dependent phosphoenolpyruvate carboxykinase
LAHGEASVILDGSIKPSEVSSMAIAAVQVTPLAQLDRGVSAWVDEVAKLTQPDRIHWCDGTQAEYQTIVRELAAKRDLLPLNPTTFPRCYLYRSHPSDVARVEHLTFICTATTPARTTTGWRPRRRTPGWMRCSPAA